MEDFDELAVVSTQWTGFSTLFMFTPTVLRLGTQLDKVNYFIKLVTHSIAVHNISVPRGYNKINCTAPMHGRTIYRICSIRGRSCIKAALK